MGKFLSSAGLSGDVRAALVGAGITLTEYRQARSADPAFDAACVDVDSAVRASIRQGLEMRAAEGNVSAAKLLASGLGRIEPKDDIGELPPHVAAAAIEAALRAIDGGDAFPPDDGMFKACPHCSGSIRVRINGTYSAPFVTLEDGRHTGA